MHTAMHQHQHRAINQTIDMHDAWEHVLAQLSGRGEVQRLTKRTHVWVACEDYSLFHLSNKTQAAEYSSLKCCCMNAENKQENIP